MKHTSDEGRNGARRNPAAGSLGSNSEIGRKLKQYYDELISEEVPDRFADLLQQLAQKDDDKALSGKE